MWEKIKGMLSIIGACLTIFCLTIVLFMLRRGETDRRGSDEASERDSAIKDGITDCEGRAERIENGISRAEDRIGKCEEHLQRAEDILRTAIERSREKREDAEEPADSNLVD